MARGNYSWMTDKADREGWYECLDDLSAILKGGGSLDDTNVREAIAAVLDLLYYKLDGEGMLQRRGRPPSHNINYNAVMVYALVNLHGQKIAPAVSAMVRPDRGTDESRSKLQQRIVRAYHKLKASGAIHQYQPQPSEEEVAAAFSRINPPKKGNK